MELGVGLDDMKKLWRKNKRDNKSKLLKLNIVIYLEHFVIYLFSLLWHTTQNKIPPYLPLPSQTKKSWISINRPSWLPYSQDGSETNKNGDLFISYRA